MRLKILSDGLVERRSDASKFGEWTKKIEKVWNGH